MYDSRKIVTGLVIGVILVTLPFWYSRLQGASGYVPEPELPKNETDCVEPISYMKAFHMDLLNRWRDAVVRHQQRVYVSTSGKKYEMSLSGTCMRCHVSKVKFCGSCHDYMGVRPYCWDCHVAPEVKAGGEASLSPAGESRSRASHPIGQGPGNLPRTLAGKQLE